MEKRMTQTMRNRVLVVLAGLALASTGPLYSQSPAERTLLDRAHSQEASGHVDLAAQSWQQVLLSDPNNTEALAGLARAAKQSGNEAEAQKYISRLRQINPNDPNLSGIESVQSTKVQNNQLAEASRLAQAGKPEDALRIYRRAFGTRPPDTWAQAYYDTEASIPSEREDGIIGLRGLVTKYPSEPRYAIDLGRVLTYEPKTRAEGERLLRQHQGDATAQAALRQALGWDVQNPASSGAIHEYLKQHNDQELAHQLVETEERQAKATNGLAKTPAEQAAFAALAANHTTEAERRFEDLHTADPFNARVLAGLGFVRMKQNDFPAAVSYLTQAEANGLHLPEVTRSLETAQFWQTMQQGTAALNTHHPDQAEDRYKAALAMRPGSADALQGLAGVYMQEQQPAQAIPIYQRLVATQPKSEQAWKGLFAAQAQGGNPQDAVATAKRFPPAVSVELSRDPEYLQTLAAAYTAAGQDDQAERVLAQALNLPFPDNGRNLKAGTRMAYAGLLAQDRHYAQAAGLYNDILNEDANNVSAWQGLVSVEHQMGHDAEAIVAVERMPPSAYDAALQNAGFLSMLAAIYQQQNHLDVAQSFLERAAKIQVASGAPPSVSLQLQIAAIQLQRNHPDQAYAIYRQVLMQHPERLDGWKGLLAALHQTGHDADGLAQIAQIPPDVRRTLEQDVEYQQTVAAIYASMGNQQAALGMVARIQAHYRAEHLPVPPDVDVQNAWLLFNTGDDRSLYRALMALGSRTDMTDDERRQVQTIWASWSVRRATQASAGGNTHRALEILNAAALAFPGNPAVSRALANGYMQAGEPKQAMQIWLSLDLTNVSAADYQGMVGAALAAQNMKQAEAWLREALAKYPNDPQILSSAARFEQARGDSARAADYWKASLNAMPPVNPANVLAHKLDQPDEVRQTKQAQPTDLVSLLNPDADITGGRTAAQVPLPSYRDPYGNAPVNTASAAPYGPDPYLTGTAPVEMSNAPAAAPVAPTSVAPAPAAAVPKTTSSGTSATQTRRRRRSAQKTSMTGQATPEAVTPQSGDSQSTERLGDYKPQASAEIPAAPYDPSSSNGQMAANGGEPYSDGSAQAGSGASLSANRSGVSSGNAGGVIGAGDGDAGPSAQLHLSISSGPVVVPETQQAKATIEAEQPVQLEIEQNLAIQTVPNVDVAAMKRTQAALAAAAKPADSTFLPTQYSPAPQQIPSEPPVTQTPQEQAQLYYERPPSALQNSTREGVSNPPADNIGASDNDLMQENLPPLRGGYRRPAIVQRRNPREEAEAQLATIEGGFSPWLGGTGLVTHRSGTAGFDQLTVLDAPFEASAPLGGLARITLIVRPSFLDTGTGTTAPILPSGASEQFGTLAAGVVPAQQNASGVGGEVQVATSNFAASAGYTPTGFLVGNAIGRLNWKPGNGPFTFTFNRDSVKDSQLSYSGARDPGSASATFSGNVWGGVIANAGQVQFGKGDASSGFYASGGGQYLSGVHVQNNARIDGDAGAYWRVLAVPDMGNLTIGANFFGMHYSHNERYFTYGQGGYFSPQAYFLANVPVTWQGRYGVNFHYTITGALGLQAFQEDSSQYFPLDTALETASNNASYASQTNVGNNYDLHAEFAYHLTDHWFAGSYLSFNNTRDYNTQTVGFFVRFLFRPQYPTELGPTGLFPADGLRPFQVP
jgi:tetratricopeptide (TPR) repeat protein